MVKFCSTCGAAVQPEARFCAGCGSALEGVPVPETEPEDSDEQPVDDKSVTPIGVGVFTFLIALPVFGLWQRDIGEGLISAVAAVVFYAVIKGIKWLLWKGGYARTLTATAPFTAFWLVIAAGLVAVLLLDVFMGLAALLNMSVTAVLVGLITRGLAALDTRRERILRERRERRLREDFD